VFFLESDFVPGHPGTPGQENFFVPGQRDNGTSRPGLTRDVSSWFDPGRPVEMLVQTQSRPIYQEIHAQCTCHT
jgi:hypothetical protein